jgi:very-short-patch-repair endonuclease
VLISRAKERVTVFSSITADDFQAEPGKVGLNAFREFLQYAEKGFFDVAEETNRDFDSDFEESVAIFLRNNGYEVKPQVGMSGFFIDLGIVHPDNPTAFLCGIECDGATYHSSKSARERDRLRQAVLESRGWRIYRIWSTDWFYRRKSEEEKLLEAIQKMTSGAYVPAAQPDAAFKPRESVGEGTLIEQPPLLHSSHEEDALLIDYVEYSESRSTDLPLHQVPKAQIDFVIRRVLEVEGPIHELEVARRLARTYGLSRTGSRIQETAKKSLTRVGATHEGEFWWLPKCKIKVRNRSMVSSRTLLSAELLPPIEILQAAKYCVSQNVRIAGTELCQSVARALGFQRVENELRETIQRVIVKAVGTSFIADDTGSYSLKV